MLENVNEKKESTKKTKSKLHKVEGFYPESELMEVQVQDENGNTIEKKYYLPLATKETWFWMCYPEGAIRTTIKELKENYVRAECRLYRHYKDHAEEYFVSAEKIVSINYYDVFYAGRTKEEIMGGYINAAKAGAESIALSKGGFGIQIESPEGSDELSDKQLEQNLVRIPIPKLSGTQKNSTQSEIKKELDNRLINPNRENTFIPYQPISAEKIPQKTTPFIQMQEENQNINKNSHEQSLVPISVVNNTRVSEYNNTENNVLQPTVQLSCRETEMQKETMTVEKAQQFVTTSKNPKFSGKTLGQIFEETPLAIPYIAITSEGEEKEAAFLLSKSNAETNAKLEQYLSR